MRMTAIGMAVLLWGAAAIAEEPPRNISFEEDSGDTWIQFEMRPGEEVFTGIMSGGQREARSLRGLVFSEEAVRQDTGLLIVIGPPKLGDGEDWALGIGSAAGNASMFSSREVSAEANEDQTPTTCARLPVKVEGLDMYHIPFRVVDGRMDAVLVAISKDRDKIKQAVKVAPLPYPFVFDWDKYFKAAFTFPAELRGK